MIMLFKVHSTASSDSVSCSIQGFITFHLQFSINKIIYKIFGAMDKDSYGQISEYFGIPSVEQLITNRNDRFLNRYRCQDNYVCQALIM